MWAGVEMQSVSLDILFKGDIYEERRSKSGDPDYFISGKLPYSTPPISIDQKRPSPPPLLPKKASTALIEEEDNKGLKPLVLDSYMKKSRQP